MSIPLRLFRELLPFSPPPAEQRTAENLRQCLRDLAGRPAEAFVLALADEILPAAQRQGNLQTRFQLLEEARLSAETRLPALEAEIGGSPLPLPPPTAGHALLADNLLKALAAAYRDLVRELLEQRLEPLLGQLFHRALLRAMGLLARRQQLAARAYAQPSPAAWLQLHELYRQACSPTARPLTADSAPIEHQYLSALLFAYLQPNRLPRGELDAAIRCTERLAAYALISEPRGETLNGPVQEFRFVVRPGEGHPGLPLQRQTATPPDALLIDCAPVAMALERNLARTPGKAPQPELDAAPSLLRALRAALDGKQGRRYRRSFFRPRGELASGLDAVLDFIDGEAPDNDTAAGEWSLVDESPDGFRIRHLRGEPAHRDVGGLVALRPRESGAIHACLVRRVANADGRLELGLQVLSPQVSVARPPDGEGPPLRALFLHNLPAYGHMPGLAAPAGRLARGRRVELQVAGQTLKKIIGPCIEAGDGLEFFALDPQPD